jgi:hypothetical protein
LAGCQIIPIDLNFHLQKCLEISDKNSADKIQFKNYKDVNPPCLMPIRVRISFVLDSCHMDSLRLSHLQSGSEF